VDLEVTRSTRVGSTNQVGPALTQLPRQERIFPRFGADPSFKERCARVHAVHAAVSAYHVADAALGVRLVGGTREPRFGFVERKRVFVIGNAGSHSRTGLEIDQGVAVVTLAHFVEPEALSFGQAVNALFVRAGHEECPGYESSSAGA
jgi:hypothetical protein